MSTKKALYAIFFSGEGVAIKVPVKKGKSITGKYYKDVVLKKLKKYYQKRRPATGFKHVRLLHDNAPAHTSAIVTAFLKKEKVTVLPHPPYSPDLAPCEFFLFPKLKAFLAERKYQSRQALGSAIHQYLITVPKSAYRDAFKKWIHRLKLCISRHGEYFKGMKWVLLGSLEIWSLQIEISNSFRTSLVNVCIHYKHFAEVSKTYLLWRKEENAGQNQQNGMCAQWRLRSAWASTQFDQSPCCVFSG